MQDDELCYLPATKVRELFGTGDVSPVEFMETTIARCERLNPILRALTDCFFDQALEKSKEAEQRFSRSRADVRPLEGLPLVIKDSHPIRGLRSTRGSRLFADVIDENTHPSVERLLDAGAVLLARGAVCELGTSPVCTSPMWGTTLNPWNLLYSSGGSTGGGAVAVAVGMTALADGSDYGGSIRIPASACGIVGYKPPWGRNPFEPPTNLDPYNHFGPMTRTVEDALLMQQVTAGTHPRDIVSLPAPALTLNPPSLSGWKVAYSMDLGFFEIESSVQANTMAAMETLEDLGCDLVEVDVGWTWEALKAWRTHFTHSFATTYGHLLERGSDVLSDYARQVLEEGREVSTSELAESRKIRADMYRQLAPVLSDHRALLCPTLAVPSVPADYDVLEEVIDIEGRPVNGFLGWTLTWPFNMLGQCPAMTVPSGLDAQSGIPTGLQIVARPFDDESAFQVGRILQEQVGWPTSFRPPVNQEGDLSPDSRTSTNGNVDG